MRFHTSSDMMSKIHAVSATLPFAMTAESVELQDIAESIYVMDVQEAQDRLKPVIDQIWRRAGRSGDVPADFPRAKDARQHLWALEDGLRFGKTKN